MVRVSFRHRKDDAITAAIAQALSTNLARCSATELRIFFLPIPRFWKTREVKIVRLAHIRLMWLFCSALIIGALSLSFERACNAHRHAIASGL
jgi:hypothetical protein